MSTWEGRLAVCNLLYTALVLPSAVGDLEKRSLAFCMSGVSLSRVKGIFDLATSRRKRALGGLDTASLVSFACHLVWPPSVKRQCVVSKARVPRPMLTFTLSPGGSASWECI